MFVVLLVMAPPSQELEPPANPGRFSALRRTVPARHSAFFDRRSFAPRPPSNSRCHGCLGTYSFTFVAKKLGYWEKRGLDLSIDRGFGSTKVCVPVDQGQYDFGLLDMAVLAGCAGRGLDLVGIAGIWPRSPIGIFSLKELNITEPKQLEGQSIGFDVGGGEFQLWPAFVKQPASTPAK